MNSKLAAVLKVAEIIAVNSGVPGVAAIDATVHAVVEKKESVDAGVIDVATNAITAVEALDGHEIADEAKFRAGCSAIDFGLKLVRESIKTKA